MDRDEYRRLFELEETLWWFRGMQKISLALLDRFATGSKPPRILDAGCGTGGMLFALRERGPVCGIDFAKDAIRFAAERSAAPLARADVSALPFRSSSFDLITSFDVIYHLNVRNDRSVLAEFARALKPDGTLLVRVPAYNRLRSRHDTAVHTRQRYGRGELEQKLRDAGLNPVFLTYANCLLFPVAVARRGIGWLLPNPASGSEVTPTPRVLNSILLAVLSLEAALIRFTRLPFGLSLVAVARKQV